jgi:hypothetical protein
MKLDTYILQSCIDYKKLKTKMGLRDGMKISFILNDIEYIGTVDDNIVEYRDKHNDLQEIDLIDFTTIDYNPKVKYKELKCLNMVCNNCPLYEIKCIPHAKEFTLLDVLEQSVHNEDVKEIYRKLLEEEIICSQELKTKL